MSVLSCKSVYISYLWQLAAGAVILVRSRGIMLSWIYILGWIIILNLRLSRNVPPIISRYNEAFFKSSDAEVKNSIKKRKPSIWLFVLVTFILHRLWHIFLHFNASSMQHLEQYSGAEGSGIVSRKGQEPPASFTFVYPARLLVSICLI